MKKFIIALLLVSSLSTMAQETTEPVVETKESAIDLGVDLQSRYIWRGLQLGGPSASAQPYLEFSAGKFAIGAWAAYSLGGVNNIQEADLYASYAISDAFSITVTDYFFPEDLSSNGYFNYKEDETGHVFEGMISFAGTEGFPIAISVATNFAGAATGETYVEASYSKEVGDVEWGIFAGAVFGDDDGYYFTDGEGLINLGLSASKEVKITDSFSLPVNAALIFNPDQENIYLTFGFSL